MSICLAAQPAGAAPRVDDLRWLTRVSYGINPSSVEQMARQGRRKFLAAQLMPATPATGLPAPIRAQIDAMEVSRRSGADLLAEVQAGQQRIRELPEDQRAAAQQQLNQRGNALGAEAVRRELLRAVYSPLQLQEQLAWFWANHFSIHQGKANVRWLLADYMDQAIRPHMLGRFRDLVLATLTHPAMLQYLDNAQNAAGRLNENYARELLELHTLGVDGGYEQQDVQELARVLTGAGVAAGPDPPKLKPEWQPLYRRAGGFEFNPARHDFGAKQLLGAPVAGQGFSEIEQAVDRIVAQPACARFVSTRLAMYFVSDEPPTALVERMASTFTRSGGDLRAVLVTMLESREFAASLGHKFKDPMHFVIGSLRLAYDGRPISNTQPIVNWLGSLGEPLFGRATPDGYPLIQSAWGSSGQMSRRFEMARAIGSGNAGLFQSDSGTVAPGFPQLANRLYFDTVETTLSEQTRTALGNAASQTEWNTLLLASPELNYR
ncbi:MAG: DUF1800 domain-containing protein [Steroidobacteraceae bacterium]